MLKFSFQHPTASVTPEVGCSAFPVNVCDGLTFLLNLEFIFSYLNKS